MDTVGKRLSYLIETKSVNMSKFCEEYGFTYSSFSPITNDIRPLGMNILKKLMEIFPNLNINWLLYGIGEINYIKNDLVESNMILQEPPDKYNPDPVEQTFLQYLDLESVRNKVKEIIKNK